MARKSRTDVRTILCCLENEMLRRFQEKKGHGMVGLCCEAAASPTCAKVYRKVLCQALGQVLLKQPGKCTRGWVLVWCLFS